VTIVFIKTTRVRDAEYIKLVESYRENGTTKHRVLYNFGRADLIRNDESFLRIVKRLCEIADMPPAGGAHGEGAPFDGCGEAVLYNYGYLAYLRLWKELGIEGCLEESEPDQGSGLWIRHGRKNQRRRRGLAEKGPGR